MRELRGSYLSWVPGLNGLRGHAKGLLDPFWFTGHHIPDILVAKTRLSITVERITLPSYNSAWLTPAWLGQRVW